MEHVVYVDVKARELVIPQACLIIKKSIPKEKKACLTGSWRRGTGPGPLKKSLKLSGG